jgi:hypothetical protein
MACTLTLAGRGTGCKDALGGIKRIYIGEWSEGIWDAVGATTAGTIDNSTAALTVYTYDMTRGSGSLTQTVTSNIEAGTVYFDQVLSATFNKLDAADIVEISNITKGRMAVIVQDTNDNYFVMGNKNGVEASGGTVQTGTAAGDQNGFTLELSAQEVSAAPFLDFSGATDTAGTGLVTVTAAP